jgi:glutathione-independent formaldehyde dehydrogenase
MKAVVYDDTRRVAVQQVPDAVVEDPGDAVIRVTSSTICGTDLHMYDGRTGAEPGLVLGHEPVGTIEQVGAAVTLLQRGERVAVPTHLFCGLCFNCIRGYTAACLRVRPGGFGAAYGYAGMGPLKLRALHTNGDFDRYWRFHLAQEHRRVHQARSQHPPVRAARSASP